jgi:hypothetical protein
VLAVSVDNPKATTLRELLVEIRNGFTLYAPILIKVGDHGEQPEHTQERTTSVSQPLDWGYHYTREYGHEPYILIGPNTLTSSESVSIGRSRTCQVRVENESVSKQHAALVCDRATGEYFVVDESSRNGTCINGEPLTAGVRMPIWPGAYVSFGDAVFVFIDPPTLRKLSRLAG